MITQTEVSKRVKVGLVRIYPDNILVMGRVMIELELGKNEKNQECLSIHGFIADSKTKEWFESGQIRETLEFLLSHDRFNKFYIRPSVLMSLLDVWKEYHLNDINAGCEHQNNLLKNMVTRDYDYLITIPEFKECPICGYAYGSKWLYKEIPIDIKNWILQFPSKNLLEVYDDIHLKNAKLNEAQTIEEELKIRRGE